MDKIFGGNQGEAEMQRIREIRQRLGIDGGESATHSGAEDEKSTTATAFVDHVVKTKV